MQRILFLASGAILLSGCSLLSNAPYSDADFQTHPQSSSYSHSNCVTSNCVVGSTYTVGHTPEHYGQEHHGHQNNHQSSYVAEYGHSPYSYDAQQEPAPYAYGSQVQNHAGHAPHQGQYEGYQHNGYQAAPQLRGAYGAAPRRGYKYGNLGVVAYDLDSDIYGIQGRLGYQSANYFGAEVEGSFGVLSDTETVGANELKAGVNYSVGAFVRGVLPLGERINVFARGGYHATEVDGSVNDGVTTASVSDTADGFAYGAGAEYALTRRDSLRLDYTRYDLGPGETDSLSLAYARKF